MRLQRLVVGVLGAALLGAVPVALTAGSARAGAPTYATDIQNAEVAPGRSVFLYGGAMTLSATVVRECTSGAGTFGCAPTATDDTVDVYRLIKGAAGFTKLATVPVSDTGAFSYKTSSVGTAAYAFVYSGSASQGYAGTDWTSAYLNGSRNPHARKATSHGNLYVRGNVDPGWGRKIVLIQRRTCSPTSTACGWHTFKKVRTTRSGAYSGRIVAPRRGSDWYRVKVPASTPRYVAGYSTKVWQAYSVYGRPAVS